MDVVIEVADDVDIDEVIDDLHYEFDSCTDNAEIVKTGIAHWEYK